MCGALLHDYESVHSSHPDLWFGRRRELYLQENWCPISLLDDRDTLNRTHDFLGDLYGELVPMVQRDPVSLKMLNF